MSQTSLTRCSREKPAVQAFLLQLLLEVKKKNKQPQSLKMETVGYKKTQQFI